MADRSKTRDMIRAIPKGIRIGEPIERGAITLIPVLTRRGNVKGAYILEAETGKGRWEPAFNLNQAILVGNITCWLGIALAWWALRRRSKGCAGCAGCAGCCGDEGSTAEKPAEAKSEVE